MISFSSFPVHESGNVSSYQKHYREQDGDDDDVQGQGQGGESGDEEDGEYSIASLVSMLSRGSTAVETPLRVGSGEDRSEGEGEGRRKWGA